VTGPSIRNQTASAPGSLGTMPETSTWATRIALHTISAHVLAHRRFAVSGRFGLRAGVGGISTPSFGDAPETIRISESALVREVGGTSTYCPSRDRH
jgi:hypothetical protein